MTSLWLPRHLAQIEDDQGWQAPLITAADVEPMIGSLDLWDMWPLALPDGSPARISGGELWMVLSAPRLEDPDQRHDHARIRLLLHRDTQWIDCGNLLPDGFAPGTREWSGSAIYDQATRIVTLFFTAAGRQGDPSRRFEQRLFQTRGHLTLYGELPAVIDWTPPVESVTSDGVFYVRTDMAPAQPGLIKGFRDPGYFRDPLDGGQYLLFTGSLQGSRQRYNGVIGLARCTSDDPTEWTLLPPMLSADGVCNEMERPHLLCRNGAYYLFWSSQYSVFSPHQAPCPTGLYGMIAPSVLGPYLPLNGSGLVIGNPAMAPTQAYCWWVTPDLRVHSFIDRWGTPAGWTGVQGGRVTKPFGGTFAPVLRLRLDGDSACMVT